MAKSLLWSMLVVAILAVAALTVIEQADDSRENLMVIGEVPGFSFLNQDSIDFSKDDLLGHINVIDFVFTNCEGPCPLMAVEMQSLYAFYTSSDQVQFVSISVDPERDTPAVLKDYAGSMGVNDSRWQFLHAGLPAVQSLLEKGFFLAADNLPHGHTTKFILVDQQAQIRGYFDFDDPLAIEVLKQNIQFLGEQGSS